MIKRSLKCRYQTLSQGLRITTVLYPEEAQEWQREFRAPRSAALWGLLLELMETMQGNRPWIDDQGTQILLEWNVRALPKDPVCWVQTPAGIAEIELQWYPHAQ